MILRMWDRLWCWVGLPRDIPVTYVVGDYVTIRYLCPHCKEPTNRHLLLGHKHDR